MPSRAEYKWPASNARFSFGLWAWCAMLLLTGCAGYRLGPTGGQTAGAKSIQVSPFVNQTLEPRLGEAVTAALRKSLQRDGTYQLATRGDADLIVNGEITRYNRFGLSYQPTDVLTVRDYRVTLTAHVTPSNCIVKVSSEHLPSEVAL